MFKHTYRVHVSHFMFLHKGLCLVADMHHFMSNLSMQWMVSHSCNIIFMFIKHLNIQMFLEWRSDNRCCWEAVLQNCLRQIFVIRANSIKTSKSKEKLLPHKTNFTSITRKEQLKQFIKRERNIRCNEIDFLYIGAYTHKISPQPHYSH